MTLSVLKGLFCLAVIGLATMLTLSKLMAGAEWVTVSTWVTAILLVGEPIGIVAAGYVSSKVVVVKDPTPIRS